MRISYREAGGFAGLNRGADVDLESLPPAEAGRLRKLVERARLGGGATRASPGARDLVGYEIAIEDDDGRTVARFDDATVPESATALLEALQERARPIPLRRPTPAAAPGTKKARRGRGKGGAT